MRAFRRLIAAPLLIVCSGAALVVLAIAWNGSADREKLVLREAGIEIALPAPLEDCGGSRDYALYICAAERRELLRTANDESFVVTVFSAESAETLGYTTKGGIANARDEVTDAYLRGCAKPNLSIEPPLDLRIDQVTIDGVSGFAARAECKGGRSAQVLLAVGLPDGRLFILAGNQVYGNEVRNEQAKRFDQLLQGIEFREFN